MPHTVRMQDAFWYVLLGVVIVGGLGAVVAFAFTGQAYDQIGKGGFFRDEDAAKRAAGGAAIDVGERDDEIRQMLTARNARRAARGLETVDVEEELTRLTTERPAIDPALEAEIRELVIARNRRRERKGEAPLDVEEEVARQVRELGAG
jgi:hypothetical protein